ncbi:DEAD/DEAH box helicase family protein, partial [Halorientalis regularis]
MEPGRIHQEFPAPSYRGYQKQALTQIKKAYQDGNDVVLIRAPTGSGKSLLARAIAGCADTLSEVESEDAATDAYYTTPQVSQIDDVAEDELLDDFDVLKGKG